MPKSKSADAYRTRRRDVGKANPTPVQGETGSVRYGTGGTKTHRRGERGKVVENA